METKKEENNAVTDNELLEVMRKENEALKRDIENYKGLIAHAAEVREGLERKLNVIREVLAL
jgi:hypothetical protein